MQNPQTTREPGAPSPRPDSLVARKVRIRSLTLEARGALLVEERARLSAAICARAGALPEFARATTVMLFASFGSEVDTSSLIAQALRDGKKVCLPRVLKPRLMAAHRVTDPSMDLAPGAWGILEPRNGLPEIPPYAIDAVIVPGAAFDAAGRRCGYGGGFYDAYLPGTRRGTPRIALAFDLQIVDDLPCEAHDLAVDIIVTETRVTRTG
ncbi:MAG TPA: 5-formyltetrahydrofolate cyclo-ligase [Thermoleophilia bacterium]|nr:5-formyltetrahydrofolate cyclo-ligase [Thermoleophilia bacterium]